MNYYYKNQEKCLENANNYYQENKEKIKPRQSEYFKSYYEDNKEAIKIRTYEANKLRNREIRRITKEQKKDEKPIKIIRERSEKQKLNDKKQREIFLNYINPPKKITFTFIPDNSIRSTSLDLYD